MPGRDWGRGGLRQTCTKRKWTSQALATNLVGVGMSSSHVGRPGMLAPSSVIDSATTPCPACKEAGTLGRASRPRAPFLGIPPNRTLSCLCKPSVTHPSSPPRSLEYNGPGSSNAAAVFSSPAHAGICMLLAGTAGQLTAICKRKRKWARPTPLWLCRGLDDDDADCRRVRLVVRPFPAILTPCRFRAIQKLPV